MVLYDNKNESYIILLDGQIPDILKSKKINKNCYLTNYGDVFKIIHCKEEVFNDFVNVAKLKSQIFKFPKVVFYDKERKPNSIIGYTMDFAPGISFSSLGPETEIRDLINAIYELEKEVMRLTNEGLQLYDLNTSNIHYDADNKKINVIDTDLYGFEAYEEYRNLLEENIKGLSRDILYLLAGYYNFKDEKIKNDFEMCTMSGKCTASIILNNILEALEKETREPIKTLGKFKEYLPLIKK